MEKSRYEMALESLKNIVEKIYGDLYNGEIPTMELPARTKYNIELDLQKGVWKYGNAKITRSAKKIDGAYTLLRTMYMMEFIR